MRGEEGVCSDSISNLAHQIPLDLTVEILTRLPDKSLNKSFHCVSNKWLSIIRSEVFMDLFTSMSQTRTLFLVAVRMAENRVSLLLSSHNETESSSYLLHTMT